MYLTNSLQRASEYIWVASSSEQVESREDASADLCDQRVLLAFSGELMANPARETGPFWSLKFPPR